MNHALQTSKLVKRFGGFTAVGQFVSPQITL